MSEGFADFFFVNPSPDHDVGSARALGDYGFVVVVEFVVAAKGDVLGIHLFEAAAVRFLSDLLREFSVAGFE